MSKSKSWPTPLKKLRERFPDADLVQLRITWANGRSLSFDGKLALLKKAVEIVDGLNGNGPG